MSSILTYGTMFIGFLWPLRDSAFSQMNTPPPLCGAYLPQFTARSAPRGGSHFPSLLIKRAACDLGVRETAMKDFAWHTDAETTNK